MPPRHRMILLLAAIVFVAVNTVNALYKGGDATNFFEGGRQLLHGETIYADSGPASGFIGPPFQALFFAPFAAVAEVSEPTARLLWYGLNVLCLVVGVSCWVLAWRETLERTQRSHLANHWTIWAALLAILLPLQTNFEHQNMNAVLLVLIGGAAWLLLQRHAAAAGALIGVATALKAFPALLIVYLAARRLWVPLSVALATAFVLTALPLLVYGSEGFTQPLMRWLQLGTQGWPTRGANQSLIAALDRVIAGAPEGVHTASQAPAELMIFLVIAIALVSAALPIIFGRGAEATLVPEIAAVTTLAVLLSPIAWDHYWVLLFPAFLVVHTASSRELLGRPALVVFWTAAILTSGLSRGTLGREGWALARHFSVSTVAALILYLTLLRFSRRLSRASSPS